MIPSYKEQVEIMVNGYIPSGKAWQAKFISGSNFRKLIEGLCIELYRMGVAIGDFVQEMLPDSSDVYLSRWENAIQIPDESFPLSSDLEIRRLNVQRKFALLGLQTTADFEGFAANIGLDIKVRSGIDHDATNGYGTELPDITFGSAKEARFTIVVTTVSDINSFDYDFDITFQTEAALLIESVFNKVKPANTTVLFVTE